MKKDELLSDEKCLKYPKFIKHLDDAYFKRKQAWAISVRNDDKLPTHSTNTSNYIEASFRVSKDEIFNRTKAFNLVDLLDILLDDSVYYKKRLLDVGNGRMGAFVNSKSRYKVTNNSNITESDIIDIGENKFLVKSEQNEELFYQVDMLSGFCQCKAGSNCGPCKHKGAISRFKHIAEFNILPESDAKTRALYHYIADGTVCSDSWYRDLDNPTQITDAAVFVDDRANNIHTRQENDQVESNPAVEIFDLNDESAPEPMEEDTVDEDDNNDILDHFTEVMDAFKDKIKNVYNSKLKKGVKFFTKKIQKMTKQAETNLEKSLFDIGKEISKPKNNLKKKKIGKLIPVQVTAKSRREYKHRGRVVGQMGRRPKDQEKRKQMVINDQNESVYHTLPKQKVSKTKQLHSLMDAVDKNRPGSKKH